MVEVKRREKESTESLLRRFTRRVQQSGILIQARKVRFRERSKSKRRVKEEALKREKIRAEKEKLRKLGIIDDEKTFKRGRR